MKRITSIGLLTLILGLGAGYMAGQRAVAEPRPEVKLMNLMRTELGIAKGIEVIISEIHIPPGTSLPTHYHPGEEFVYMLEGSGTAWLKDKPDVHLRKGEVFKVPIKQIHTAKTADEGFKAIVFRVHRMGEPERILAD